MKLTPSQIDEKLKSFGSLPDVREFIAALGFAYADEQLSERNLQDKITGQLQKGSLRIIGRALNYPVVFVQAEKNGERDLDRQLIRLERSLIPKLPPEIQDACMVVAASASFERVHFVNAKRMGKRLLLRRFLTGGEHKTRTAAERFAYLQLTGDEDWAKVLDKVGEAFDRDKVTDQFFKQFYKVFNDIKKELIAQHKDERLAHQFLHALLNRLMFIYFVQRKRWECFADGDPEFIKTLWDTYRYGDFPKDTFYRDWLSTLFFYAFNNKMEHAGVKLPPELMAWFRDAPYLDGGLFSRNDFDTAAFTVTDSMFERIFTNILDAYNFTVTEDTPFDQNIAVDPEMLGIVYESLVNTTELSDEKAEVGIFYTPRIEVDFMCRRALVEHLAKTTNTFRGDLYRFVFPEDSDEQIAPVFPKHIREEIDDALVSVTVVDPACGSGAFLVGMMQVVLELRRELWKQRGNKEDSFNDFNERRKIIEGSLYGVDVKDWAISIAELRLWLTLIEVADEKKLDLRRMKQNGEALLPKFNFKLRVGDSLVQEIAGVSIPIRSAKGRLSPSLQRKVNDLRKRKREFYENKGEITEAEIRKRETALYKAILDERIAKLRERKAELLKPGKAAFQEELLAAQKSDVERAKEYAEFQAQEDKKRAKKIEAIDEEIAQLIQIKKNLGQKLQRVCFWSIEFAEIFQDKGGFDIVIGNPPYVRQEKIADPLALEAGEEPDVDEKRAYKDKLFRMVGDDWGFVRHKGKDVPAVNIGKRADLYVYFYLRGMALLRSDSKNSGTFVFITSNSWLDVGYGKGLQEFLLKRARVLVIYDNEAKRSFKRADVNTIIAVLEPLPPKTKPDAKHKARFVMFKQPFEDAVSSDTLLATEAEKERTVIYRKVAQASSLQNELSEGILKRTRGYLPHWEARGATYFVTFRLADSLPKKALAELLQRKSVKGKGESFEIDSLDSLKHLDRLLEKGHGDCHLKNPRIAATVKRALEHFNGQRYHLYACCIMPNHVHVVFRPFDGYRLPDILHSWKSYSANEAHNILGRTGAFWQKESYDRLIRDEAEFMNTVSYVLKNPSAAGLQDWKWVWSDAGGPDDPRRIAEQTSSPQDNEEDAGRDACATDNLPLARVFPLTQSELYRQGLEPSDVAQASSLQDSEKAAKMTSLSLKDDDPFASIYTGNKWGGKYLRAPEIYWKILEKGKGKLVRLGDIADVRRGFTTGANEFFFLKPAVPRGSAIAGCVYVENTGSKRAGTHWEGWIDVQSLSPCFQNTAECSTLTCKPAKQMFTPKDNRAPGVRMYIAFGERLGHHKSKTCAGRKQWWRLSTDSHKPDALGFNYNLYDTGRTYRSTTVPTFFSDNFHTLHNCNLDGLHGYLNSTLFHLLVNIEARVSFGGGKAKLQTYELASLLALKDLGAITGSAGYLKLYARICRLKPQVLNEEINLPARRALDKIIFDILGLTEEEREEVYNAVVDLVEKRLNKARSV